MGGTNCCQPDQQMIIKWSARRSGVGSSEIVVLSLCIMYDVCLCVMFFQYVYLFRRNGLRYGCQLQGYSQCLDAFVEHMQINAFRGDNIFDDILSLCQKTESMLKEIFPNPDQVMSKLVLNLFHGKLQVSSSFGT